MRSLSYIFWFWGLLSTCSWISAQPLSGKKQEAYTKAFERKQKETQTFQADLKQTLRLRGMRDPIESNGWIYYRAPDLLLIRYGEPKGEFILVEGKNLYVKRAGKPLIRKKLKAGGGLRENNIGALLSLFQDGGQEYSRELDVQMEQQKNQLLVCLNHPEGMVIQNSLTLPNLELKSIRVILDSENSISYELSRIIRNKPLDPKVFDLSGK